MTLSAPYPSLAIRYGLGALAERTMAIVDSGFDGYIAIPISLRPALPGPDFIRRIRTASGEIVTVPGYYGWDELASMSTIPSIPILVLGDEYLIGIRVMNHFRVIFDHGRQVIVEP